MIRLRTSSGALLLLVLAAAHASGQGLPTGSFRRTRSSLRRLSRRIRPGQPVLIRIETRSGHGAVNLAKQLDQTADIYSFMLYNMGVTPSYPAIP